MTAYRLAVAYLEPVPKPEGPVIPDDIQRVDVVVSPGVDAGYTPTPSSHRITDHDTIRHLVDLANGLEVLPGYQFICVVGPEDETTLTFVGNGGKTWEVRMIDYGCPPAYVEFDGYPRLADTHHMLRDVVEAAIGADVPTPTPLASPEAG